jgi:hypothetical protein
MVPATTAAGIKSHRKRFMKTFPFISTSTRNTDSIAKITGSYISQVGNSRGGHMVKAPHGMQ